jgi:hypothetical protein
LGGGKWGVGPTGVILKIDGQFTYGALANYLWSFAGQENRGEISATYVQPFFAYTTKGTTTWSLQSEASYDWIRDNWSIPVSATVAQLVVLGGRPISLGAGGKYWLASPAGGPDWGIRFNVSLLFPQK